MNSQDEGATPAAAAPAPQLSARLESAFELAARELLRERRAERRWRIFFRLVWLGLALAVAWALLSQRMSMTAPTGPHTALVDIRGELDSDADANADSLVAALTSAFEDAGAQAVVLRINSPGGSPVQAGIVNDEIRRLKALHGKKIYTVVEEICASGAYYVAVATDDIYVDKASLVGSIGVLMEGFGFVGLMDKLGIERRLLTAGENKGMLDPFSPQDEKQRAYAKLMIDQVHQQFIKVVREGRGAAPEGDARNLLGPVLERRGSRQVRLGRPLRQPGLRGARGHQGARGHRLHAQGERRRAPGASASARPSAPAR